MVCGVDKPPPRDAFLIEGNSRSYDWCYVVNNPSKEIQGYEILVLHIMKFSKEQLAQIHEHYCNTVLL